MPFWARSRWRDIGMHFPDTDPARNGASSAQFLEHAVKLAGEKGYHVVKVESTVVLERPKLKTTGSRSARTWPRS